MKAPSLYKHFPDKESLELELIILGFEESAAAFEAALAPAAAVADRGARGGVPRRTRARIRTSTG